MTNSVQAAAARIHWRALVRLYGEPVTYRRGALAIQLTAVPADVAAKQIGAGEAPTLISRQLDWLIDPAELVDGDSAAVIPQKGDEIVRASGDVCRLQPQKDTVWRWSDATHTWRRVHTSQV